MNKEMMAYCGTYCEVCEWKDKVNCSGCKANGGKMFWGECDKAKCCIEKGFEHCGECPELPCQMITDLINDPEHGDNGMDIRLSNLRGWKNGSNVYKTLDNQSQKQAKNL